MRRAAGGVRQAAVAGGERGRGGAPGRGTAGAAGERREGDGQRQVSHTHIDARGGATVPPVGRTYALEPSGDALHGYFSRELAPVLTVDPGDAVRLRTLDSGWSAGRCTADGYLDRPRVPEHRPEYGHALVGPVAVRGARPGTTLTVRIDALVPAAW